MAKSIPYEFVLDHLESANPITKLMFGHIVVYAAGRMVMFFISKDGNPDNGVCLATSAEHIPSLKKDFPSLRPLKAYGATATDWRLLPLDSEDFEESALQACELILKNDPRIGRTPKSRKSTKRKATKVKKKKSRA
jgi:hypothetical protein